MSANRPRALQIGRACAGSSCPDARRERIARGKNRLADCPEPDRVLAPEPCSAIDAGGQPLYLPARFRNPVKTERAAQPAEHPRMSIEPPNAVPRGSDGGQKRDSHVPALDGLRGLAIIMVLFVHFIGDAQPYSAFERILMKASNYGMWGVDLFFSGYLITGILYDSKGSAHYFRNFYMRRVLRIFPLYYGVLFFVLPLFPSLVPTGLAESSCHQAWVWSYGVNLFIAQRGEWALPYISHFWSLAV